MRELRTEIDIEAPIEKVWEIFTDFDKYPEWNPFIKSIEGELEEGKTFKVVLEQPDSAKMVFKPKCLKFEENSELVWLGSLFMPGIFDGKHIFEFVDVNHSTTKFIQREEFKGVLVPLMWKQLNTKTRQAFEAMNEKLKELAETAIHQEL